MQHNCNSIHFIPVNPAIRNNLNGNMANKFPPKSRYGVQTRLRALLEPVINKKRESNESEHRAYRR